MAWARLIRASGIPISCDRLGRGGGRQQGGRIRQADVLAGVHHQPAGDEPRVLAGHDHPRQVVQRGIDVGAPDGLDEGADHVVVLIAVAVVANRGRVDRLFQAERLVHLADQLIVPAALLASGHLQKGVHGLTRYTASQVSSKAQATAQVVQSFLGVQVTLDASLGEVSVAPVPATAPKSLG